MLISTKLGLLGDRFVAIFCTAVLISQNIYIYILNVSKPLSQDLSPSHPLEPGAREKEFWRYSYSFTQEVNTINSEGIQREGRLPCSCSVESLSEEHLIKGWFSVQFPLLRIKLWRPYYYLNVQVNTFCELKLKDKNLFSVEDLSSWMFTVTRSNKRYVTSPTFSDGS